MKTKSPFNKWLAECDFLCMKNFGNPVGGNDRKLFIKKAKRTELWKRVTPQALVDDIRKRIEILKEKEMKF